MDLGSRAYTCQAVLLALAVTGEYDSCASPQQHPSHHGHGSCALISTDDDMPSGSHDVRTATANHTIWSHPLLVARISLGPCGASLLRLLRFSEKVNVPFDRTFGCEKVKASLLCSVRRLLRASASRSKVSGNHSKAPCWWSDGRQVPDRSLPLPSFPQRQPCSPLKAKHSKCRTEHTQHQGAVCRQAQARCSAGAHTQGLPSKPVLRRASQNGLTC